MRRATLLLLATIAAMLLATGIALAATKTGTSGNDLIYGTSEIDLLKGEGGADALFGRANNDTLYGGPGNDNIQTYMLNASGNFILDKKGKKITAGLRGAAGNDAVYGQAGNDDVIGNIGNDNPLDDSSPSNINDWDRAFGGTGNDTINVADGDTRDEVSCGEDTTSPTPSDGDTDTVKIDVVRGDPLDPERITAADKVYEKDANGNSTECENIEETAGNQEVTQDQLPQSASETAAVEPPPE